MAAKMQLSRSETASPLVDQSPQSTRVFEKLAKQLHRLESKLGMYT